MGELANRITSESITTYSPFLNPFELVSEIVESVFVIKVDVVVVIPAYMQLALPPRFSSPKPIGVAFAERPTL